MFKPRFWVVSAAATAALLLTACSAASPESPTTEPTANPSANVTSAEDLAWAKDLTSEYMAGNDRDLPSTGPEAVADKNVWVIACTATGAGCNLPAQGVAEAGEKLGWKVTVVDGKLDPTVYNTAVRNATAAKADAIVLAGVDCAPIYGAIQSAQAEGVLVFGLNALDCDDEFAGGDGKKLFTNAMTWGAEQEDYGYFIKNHVAPAIAAWVIDKTQGEANIILMHEADNATTRHVGETQQRVLAERCAGCTVNVVDFTGSDLLGGLQAKVSAALQKYPNANVVMTPIDAAVSLGASAAVQQARAQGREILLVGQEGVPANVQLIKDGIQDYAVGRPMTWVGWAGADQLNRLFAGEPLVDQGIGFGSIDKDHLPDGDVYDGNPKSQNYRENYMRIWGVS